MAVLTEPGKHLKMSQNTYDWLGEGIYFWENDPVRAFQFAEEGMGGRVTKGKIKKPFVIGAVIDLGLCLNLFDQAALKELAEAYDYVSHLYEGLGLELPANGKGHLIRPLDRMVINYVHTIRESLAEDNEVRFRPYQTVRAGFSEGEALFPGTSITRKQHIQIAVRDRACIKGYFLPRGM